jgi:hypothetical protein
MLKYYFCERRFPWTKRDRRKSGLGLTCAYLSCPRSFQSKVELGLSQPQQLLRWQSLIPGHYFVLQPSGFGLMLFADINFNRIIAIYFNKTPTKVPFRLHLRNVTPVVY